MFGFCSVMKNYNMGKRCCLNIQFHELRPVNELRDEGE